ncbi:MAG: FAD/NAD(P)-binding protein, partial [Bacteroidia bacterium]
MPSTKQTKKTKIAILGGGPSGLFLFKKLLATDNTELEIDIFERSNQLGAGMPYSCTGANNEHITNVSENEIPELVTSITAWAKTLPTAELSKYNIDPDHFNEYKVLPRLFFGMYLSAQFELLLKRAKENGVLTTVHLNSEVEDIIDRPELNETWVDVAEIGICKFDAVVVCTGHSWPKIHEGKVEGYFDSPYPPSKLNLHLNHPVALRGSSLTAIDAIRTIARNNGRFFKDKDQKLAYLVANDSPNFKIVMHTRSGMLPAVRFHLDDSHLSNESLLTEAEIAEHIKQNNGFLSLDFIFEKDFKDVFRDKDPQFYEQIKDMQIEDFV